MLLGDEELTVEKALAAPAGDALREGVVGDVRRRRRPRARPLRLLVRALPALLGRLRRRPRRCCRASRSSASTSSTCRRSTRSARRTARAGTTPRRQSAVTSAARGRSARRRAATTRSTRRSAPRQDFRALVTAAKELEIEIALDFAIQCSPDHPWLKEHPEWFFRRPDGTLKYAENPPKRYQDIYNVDFGSEDWRGLWQALHDVVLHWVGCGITVFRVDNPHTKPVPFWEWLIGEVRREHPEVIFLSEAFTRPAPMTTLAKAGFAQSYTYFTWKNTRWELLEFLGQLLEWREFYRPNCFANTPDILHEYLQAGGRPAFEARLVLAATLSPSYGIYSGFEHCENVPVRPGSEEYLNSEKYELKRRTLDGPLLPLAGRAQRRTTRERGAAVARPAHDPRDRERAPLRLPQAARSEHRRHGRQPRPARDPGRRLRRAGLDRAPAGVPGARPAVGRDMDVAHRPQLRQARPWAKPRPEDRRMSSGAESGSSGTRCGSSGPSSTRSTSAASSTATTTARATSAA